MNDDIIARLKSLILSRRLGPGARLPTEHELAERFGVSRLSVREAVRALRFLGLVESSPRRGLSVGRLDVRRVGESLGFDAAVCGHPDEQLVRARLALEVGILPLVADAFARDPTWYDRLHALTVGERLLADPDAYVEADLAFHAGLMAAAGVQPLTAFSDVLRAFFARFGERAAADRRPGIALHRALLAALRDGDLAEAQELVLRSFATYGFVRAARPARGSRRTEDR